MQIFINSKEHKTLVIVLKYCVNFQEVLLILPLLQPFSAWLPCVLPPGISHASALVQTSNIQHRTSPSASCDSYIQSAYTYMYLQHVVTADNLSISSQIYGRPALTGDWPHWQPAIAVIIVQSVTDVLTWLINSLSFDQMHSLNSYDNAQFIIEKQKKQQMRHLPGTVL